MYKRERRKVFLLLVFFLLAGDDDWKVTKKIEFRARKRKESWSEVFKSRGSKLVIVREGKIILCDDFLLICWFLRQTKSNTACLIKIIFCWHKNISSENQLRTNINRKRARLHARRKIWQKSNFASSRFTPHGSSVESIILCLTTNRELWGSNPAQK